MSKAARTAALVAAMAAASAASPSLLPAVPSLGSALARNTHSEFVGVVALKEKHAVQVAQFERWAEARAWSEFHRNHYDWFAFPISKPSSYGFKFSVFAGDVAELKEDVFFSSRYLRGVELLMQSWGYSLREKRELLPSELDDPASQRWQDWPVRLHKATTSLIEFGFPEEGEALLSYGRTLLGRGHVFAYGPHDLSDLFLSHHGKGEL